MEKSLSLKDFIKKSLVDINTAVVEASKEGVSLAHYNYEDGINPKMQTIEFDLAVTIEESSESTQNKNGGISISVFSAKLGRNNKEDLRFTNTNRIKFSVDIFLGLKNNK